MNNNKRTICVVTSTRADYGILSNLLMLLHKEETVNLKLAVTGTHLSTKFGSTINEISLPIDKKIDIEVDTNPIRSTAIAVEKFYEYFSDINPDLVLLLGDRYEIQAVAIAAMHSNIPIAHLYGGDITLGAIDDAIRHTITKMSHLHFVSCEQSRQRVIQLGESPDRVFDYGALGVENIKQITLYNKKELEQLLNFEFKKKNILATFHPITLESNTKEQFQELLNAFEYLDDTNIIITYPNSDAQNTDIIELIKAFELTHENFKVFTSLGHKKYLSCLQFVDMVVGNSSSGIYEVPTFKIPTVNIGNRQKGRMQAKSVINCQSNANEILNAINEAYQLDCSNIVNPYQKENTAKNIMKILKSYPLKTLINKEFYKI